MNTQPARYPTVRQPLKPPVMTYKEFKALPVGTEVTYTPTGDKWVKDHHNAWLVTAFSSPFFESLNQQMNKASGTPYYYDSDFWPAVEHSLIEFKEVESELLD